MPQPVFLGHSDHLTLLAGYNPKAALAAAVGHAVEATPSLTPPPAHFVGGFAEVLVPPRGPMPIKREAGGISVAHPPRLPRTYALAESISGLGTLLRAASGHDNGMTIIRGMEDFQACARAGRRGIVLQLADADSISESLEELYLYHAAGVRSIGITWSRANRFGFGPPYEVPGTADAGPGLSAAGRALVRSCNALGMIVDLAHLNTAGFWDVAEISDAPLVICSGSAAAIFPTSRASSDDKLLAVADSGGLIGISSESLRTPPEGHVAAALAHIRHVADLVGVEHVALGMDLAHLEGEPGRASPIDALVHALERAGFSGDELAKICLGNWERVFRTSWGM